MTTMLHLQNGFAYLPFAEPKITVSLWPPTSFTTCMQKDELKHTVITCWSTTTV